MAEQRSRMTTEACVVHALAAAVLNAELRRELGAGCDQHSGSGTESFWSAKLWLSKIVSEQ